MKWFRRTALGPRNESAVTSVPAPNGKLGDPLAVVNFGDFEKTREHEGGGEGGKRQLAAAMVVAATGKRGRKRSSRATEMGAAGLPAVSGAW